MSEDHPHVGLQDIEDENPVLTGRPHADVEATVPDESSTECVKVGVWRREGLLQIRCAVVSIGGDDRGDDRALVDIDAAADWVDDFHIDHLPSVTATSIWDRNRKQQ